MPQKNKKELHVSLSFEPSRIKAIHLADAFEHLIPLVKRKTLSTSIIEDNQNNDLIIHQPKELTL